MEVNEIKYEERLVAFIDILGFKEIVKQSENDPSKISLIYSVLNYLKNWEIPEKWNLKFIEIEEDAQKKGDVKECYRYFPQKSKPIIDKIDTVLARHYGFTEEELDFIINYDIKYRMGKALFGEEENGEDED